MTKITVKVSDYYNRPEMYPFMPEKVFNILEKAFIDCAETVDIDEDDLIMMNKKLLNDASKDSKTKGN